MKPRWFCFAVFTLFLACEPPAATPKNIKRIVTIGDNVASNPTLSTSYASMLERNDDVLFPEFSGRDLRTTVKALESVRLDRGGDSYGGVAANMKSLCTCAGDGCKTQTTPCLNTTDSSPTLLVIELGVNDLLAGALRLLSDETLRADPSPLTDEFRKSVHKVLSIGADKKYFAHPPLTYVLNVYDPSDGVGDLVALAATLLPLPSGANGVTAEMTLTLIAAVNGIIAEETAEIGGTLIDVHGAFLGHGLHHADSTSVSYRADDPTQWIRGFIDPNLRGSHEVRRLLWEAFTGEAFDTLPGDLPSDNTLGLPVVPEAGWADAIVDENVALETDTAKLGKVPNIDHDAQMALGKTDSLSVALGTIGNYIVVDLGQLGYNGDGVDIVVMEQGALSGGAPEPYRVLASVEPQGPFVRIGDGMGERAYDLADGGLDRARYIRVESLAQPSDIGRIGSPFAPGPEIDSVGAVYLDPP